MLHMKLHCSGTGSVSLGPNPSLHPTFASRLRRLSPAGELKR